MKKVTVYLAAILLVLGLSVSAWAAVAVEHGLGFLHVTLDGSGNYDWSTTAITAGNNTTKTMAELYPQGIRLTGVTVYPATAAATKFVLRNLTTSGTIMPGKMANSVGDTMVKYFDGNRSYKPCAAHADQTNDTDLEFWLEYSN